MRFDKYKINLLIPIFILTNLNAIEKNYFEDSKRGWFWGEIKPQKKEEKDSKKEIKNNILLFNGKEYKTIPQNTSIPWAILDKLHPDEISKLETETKNISVMYPTYENILDYKKLQKYISSKAMNFTDTNYLVSKQDSDISNWVSDTSMSSRLVIDSKRTDLWKKQKEIIKKHKNSMIILVATLPTCSFCKEQVPLLEEFEKEYEIEFKEVDISKNINFAQRYEIKKTPDLFLLYKNNNNEPLLTRFGNGLHTIQDLKSGVLASLYTFKKISKDYLEY